MGRDEYVERLTAERDRLRAALHELVEAGDMISTGTSTDRDALCAISPRSGRCPRRPGRYATAGPVTTGTMTMHAATWRHCIASQSAERPGQAERQGTAGKLKLIAHETEDGD